MLNYIRIPTHLITELAQDRTAYFILSYLIANRDIDTGLSHKICSREIADALSISHSYVRGAVKCLKDMGYIKVASYHNGTYQFSFPCLEADVVPFSTDQFDSIEIEKSDLDKEFEEIGI